MKSWYANIWIAGSYDQAVHACREWCKNNPLCVTVTPTEFVYSGGAESGVCVRVIQYPRFPTEESALWMQAVDLAAFLRARLFQRSFTVEGRDETIYDSLPAPR
jgi:hypothetical protein